MKKTLGVLFSATVLSLASVPSAHAGFLFFGHRHPVVVVQAPAPPVVVAPEIIVERPAPPIADNVVVVSRPPAVIREVITPCPGRAFEWVGGFWSWNNRAWVWVRGHWEPRPHPRAVWVTGHWTHYRDHGYRFVPGYWR